MANATLQPDPESFLTDPDGTSHDLVKSGGPAFGLADSGLSGPGSNLLILLSGSARLWHPHEDPS
jgi:hypothetical protein